LRDPAATFIIYNEGHYSSGGSTPRVAGGVDLDLMQKFINFFGCGRLRLRPRGEAVDFLVTKIKDLNDKVIPFFEKIPLQGLKSKNFSDFHKAADILKIKRHLTLEGLDKIRQIKDGMNSRRI
jgi:hypothetical protein